MIISEILAKTKTEFKKKSIDSPRLTAEILLSHVLKLKPSKLCLNYHQILRQDEIIRFNHLVKRRLQHEPTAYILGERGFFESDFTVTQDVLIPRPETELLVEEALSLLHTAFQPSNGIKVLELGTGSGAVIISLARACPGPQYFASDISPSALNIAVKNAGRIAPGQISFFLSNWFSAIRQNTKPQFGLIISNPPYIPTHTVNTLAPEICDYEPLTALDGGEDGLDAYRIILDQAAYHLISGGILLLETGYDQKNGIKKLLDAYSDEYDGIEFIKDLAGQQRVVKITKK